MHLPLIPLGDEGLSRGRLLRTVDAAREHGFAALCANDHFLFGTPWLDGPTALAAVAGQKQVSLYNTDTAQLLGVLPFPEGIPHVLQFSRNGSVLLVGGGRGGHSGLVVLFDVKTGKRIAKVEDVVSVGDKLQVEIAEIDARGKISLVPVQPEAAASAGSAAAPADAVPAQV